MTNNHHINKLPGTVLDKGANGMASNKNTVSEKKKKSTLSKIKSGVKSWLNKSILGEGEAIPDEEKPWNVKEALMRAGSAI